MTDAPIEHLIVFARWPEAGTTKTRLIPALGPEGAAHVQRRMTQHTLRITDRLARERGVHVELRYAGGDETKLTSMFGRGRRLRPQGEGDLGARLARAVHESAEAGAGRIVVIGTDCPAITVDLLARAFDALGHGDVVLGPAEDGGYYLVGVQRPHPELFEDIAWSTDRVLEETLRVTAASDLRVTQLEALPDVDRPEDLEACETELERSVTVVMPTRNEGARLAETLDVAMRHGDAEVVVADGGSSDETLDIARKRGVRIVASAPGRAVQMNAGAEAAVGGLLLFCHADTHLPDGYERLAREALRRPEAVAGAFDLALRGEGAGLRRIERGVARRSRRKQLPYGDQAIFLTRRRFRELGGFRELPIMEDYDLIQRAKRLGQVVIADGSASTSARYWRTHGTIRGTLRNQAVLLGWRLGVSPARLARWRRGP